MGRVALAVPLLVVAGVTAGAGRASAAPDAGRAVASADGAGIGVAVCVDGRIVRRLVRLDVSLPLLPSGGLSVRVGEPCGTPSGGSTPTQPPPTTPTPSSTPTGTAPTTVPPASGPGSVPPPPPPSAGPAPSSRTPADRAAVRPAGPPASSTAPGPAPSLSPSPSLSLSPAAASVPVPVSLPASDDGKPRPADGRPSVEPFAEQAAPSSPDAGDGAARWWMLSMLAVLLPAALAALPRLTDRRR